MTCARLPLHVVHPWSTLHDMQPDPELAAMYRTLSLEERRAWIVALYAELDSQQDVAARLGINKSTVSRVLERLAEDRPTRRPRASFRPELVALQRCRAALAALRPADRRRVLRRLAES